MRKVSLLKLLPGVICILLSGTIGGLSAIQLPEGAEREEIHPGAWRFSWETETEAGPVAVHGFYWRLAQEELRMVASAGKGVMRENEEVSAQAERFFSATTTPVAAVNADFFAISGSAAGAVNGLFIRNGELLSGGHGPAAAFFADGSMILEEFSTELRMEMPDGEEAAIHGINVLRGADELVLYTPAWGGMTFPGGDSVEVRLEGRGRLRPTGGLVLEVVARPSEAGGGFVLSAHGDARQVLANLRPGERVTIQSRMTPDLPVANAVGGLPIMIREGTVRYFPGAKHEDFVPGPGNPNTRHPRTAIGTDGEYGVVVVVDGRAPGYSVGMTIPEVGELMREMGCTEALNLDGGGSSAVWASGAVLNRPSGGVERPVGNALVLLSAERKQEASQPEVTGETRR